MAVVVVTVAVAVVVTAEEGVTAEEVKAVVGMEKKKAGEGSEGQAVWFINHDH